MGLQKQQGSFCLNLAKIRKCLTLYYIIHCASGKTLLCLASYIVSYYHCTGIVLYNSSFPLYLSPAHVLLNISFSLLYCPLFLSFVLICILHVTFLLLSLVSCALFLPCDLYTGIVNFSSN